MSESYKMLWYCTYSWGSPGYWIGTKGKDKVCGIREQMEKVASRATYKVYKISDKQYDLAAARHKVFQEKVGYHCDRDPKVYKPYEDRGQEMLSLYYQEREKVDYDSPPSRAKLIETVTSDKIEWFSVPSIQEGDKKSGGKRGRK